MSVQQVQTLLEQTRASFAADDYAAALRYALQAKAVLAGIPDADRQGSSLTWRPKEIDDLIALAKAGAREVVAAAGGWVQATRIERLAETDTGDFA